MRNSFLSVKRWGAVIWHRIVNYGIGFLRNLLTMFATIFPPSNQSSFLSAHQIEDRLKATFPGAVFDWAASEKVLRAELEKLEQWKFPEPLLEGHRNLLGNTVLIKIPFENTNEMAFSFVATIDTPLEIKVDQGDGNKCELIRNLIKKVAHCLGYHFEISKG